MRDRYANLREGLVGAWCPSIRGSGFLLPDLSGRGNNGTLTNMAADDWVSSQYGTAMDFDGSNDFVSLGNNSVFQINTGTICAWIKTSNAGSSYRAILTKQLAYGMYLQGNVFMIYDFGSSSDRSTGINLADNRWHYVATTFQSGVTNGTFLYVDGISRLTTTMTISDQQVQVLIGEGNTNSQHFAGQFDDLRIYNRVLSESEIRLLASRPGIGLTTQRRPVYFLQSAGIAKPALFYNHYVNQGFF